MLRTPSKAAHVNRKGEVKWYLQEIEVPTVEQSVREDALEVQDIRELGLGLAWFVNDLCAFLPSWQDMELASPSNDEPATQIEADVPIEPLALRADAMDLELELHSYERPLAVSPFGTPELVSNWQDTHAMKASVLQRSQLGRWIRTDLGVRTFQGLGKNSPAKAASRATYILTTSLNLWHANPISRCHCTVGVSLIAAMQLLSHVTLRPLLCNVFNQDSLVPCRHFWITIHPFFLRGRGFHLLFKNWHACSQHVGHTDFVVYASIHRRCWKGERLYMMPNLKRWIHHK